MVVFKYREEKGRKGTVIYRPVADIELKGKNSEWIACHPYIDSGADVTLIPLSLGRLLSLDIEKDKIEELYGLGKQGVPVIFKNIKMRISEYIFTTEIAWALTEEVVPLLGRVGIFDKFHINFKQNQRIIEFNWVEKG